MSPLVLLYGANAINDATKEIDKLSKNSNIPFDRKYLELGVSFLMLKAQEVLDGKTPQKPLPSLVSESFGEAAIYKYNIANGVL